MKKICLMAVLTLFLSACHESLEDRCEREAKEYTAKNCPAKLDKNIRIDSLTFDKDSHTLHYFYTLTDAADNDGVLEAADAINVLRKELKNSTSMKTYKDNKYNFRYTYRSDKDPSKIRMDVTFTAKDY
mgnify:CR=1 FL=1